MPAELASSLTATDDERLEQAEALVRAYCGWHIAPSRTETVTVRGQGGRTLMLPSLHVTDVASVTAGDTLLTVDDDYVWSSAGVVSRGYYSFWCDTEVVVEMTHGYSVIPPEVTAVVQALAQRLIGNPAGLASQTIGPFSETYARTLSDSERDALRPYRIPSVG